MSAILGELVEREHRRLVAYLSRVVGQAAEDLVQETYCSLVGRDLPGSSHRAYLWTAALNQLRDYRRWRRRTARFVALDPEMADRTDPIAALHTRLLLEWALRQLRHRDLFLLQAAGYSQPEIARITGLPLGTVKRRMQLEQIRMRRGA